jgi:hypothetical protein
MINCVYQPFKAVSLLEILRHDAAAFWELSRLLQVLATDNRPDSGGVTFGAMSSACEQLNLLTSKDQIDKFRKRIEEKGVNDSDLVAFGKTLSSVIHSELKSKTFVFISEDRAQYLEAEWANELFLIFVFDRAEKELLAAGRCFAYGEPDASVFHSMRALEPCLEALAHALNVAYDRTNWQQAISSIEKKIRQLSEPPKEQRKKMTEEDHKAREFYSELATQFVFVKDGWRNHTMHGTRNYSDREARIIMDTVGNILRVAATRLEEVSDKQRSVQSGFIEAPKSLPRGDEEKA